MRNIEHLSVMVNGRNLSYHRTLVDGNVVYEAEFDRRIVTGPLFEIDLAVDALQTPPGGTRSLGIAVRRVEVLPIKD